MDDRLSSDLDAWLNNATVKYTVTQTLHETPEETTQIVYRIDEDGHPSIGPFVRKRFVDVGNRGNVYEQLLQAQVSGRRLPHQPLIYECERDGDSLTVIMEHVEGETLRDMARRGNFGLDFAKRVTPDLCDASRSSTSASRESSMRMRRTTPFATAHRDMRRPSSSAMARPAYAATCTPWA